MKLNYFLIPLITFLTAFLGSLATSRGMEWYNTLKLPSLAPQGSFIGMVWTIIFILSTVSALLVWNNGQTSKKFWLVIGLFIANAVLNFLWSVIFFGFGQIGLSIIEMFVLEATVVALILLIWPISRISSILLVPYAIWVGFATYLAYSIWSLNK